MLYLGIVKFVGNLQFVISSIYFILTPSYSPVEGHLDVPQAHN